MQRQFVCTYFRITDSAGSRHGNARRVWKQMPPYSECAFVIAAIVTMRTEDCNARYDFEALFTIYCTLPAAKAAERQRVHAAAGAVALQHLMP
jgi:hypothetical protein